jgi:hypothetical protein
MRMSLAMSVSDPHILPAPETITLTCPRHCRTLGAVVEARNAAHDRSIGVQHVEKDVLRSLGF